MDQVKKYIFHNKWQNEKLKNIYLVLEVASCKHQKTLH